jgi:hypothetical protein
MPLTKIQSLGITDGTIVNADINASAAIAGTKLTGAGKVLQVVNANYGTITNSSSGTYSDTGLTASITPTSASNKILVLVNQSGLNCATASNGINLKLVRNSTDLIVFAIAYNYATADIIVGASASYLDSPSTTSSTTYKTQQARYGGAGQVRTQNAGESSTITLLEIAP